MPSEKRKLKQLQNERAKLAKTNKALTSFFSVNRSTDTCEDVATERTCPEVSHQESPETSSRKIITAKKTGNSKHKIGFDSNWARDRPWLIHKVDTDNDGIKVETMLCQLCSKHKTQGKNGNSVWTTSGCRSLRYDRVTEHGRSDQHLEAVRLETEAQMTIEKSMTERTPLNEKEFEAVVCASKVVHFLVKHNIPHTTVYEDFIDFAINELKSPILANLSKGKNASYKSRATAEELLAAMSEDIEETVKQNIRDSHAYSVLTDEATDPSNKKHLAFCVKYADSKSGEVKVDFVKDVQVDNGKAETIFNETELLVQNELGLDKFVAFGSDGCNTMIGRKSGVATRLKEIKPELVTVHCHNHRLALAAKDSFESIKLFRDTDDLLGGIHKYYKSSSNRTRSLEKLQNILEDVDTKRIKQVAHTRWLSHHDAVTSLRDTYPAVLMDLENAVESGTDKVRVGSGPSASGLAKKMKSYQTIHITHFLCDALRPLTQLALTFESNNVDLSVIKPKMDATISSLKKLKSADGVSMKKATKLLCELEITPTEDQISNVRQAECQFLNNLIDNLESRLENSDILDNLSVFSMRDTSSLSGNDEIELLAEHFNQDVNECLYEWDQLKETVKDLDQKFISTPSSLTETITKTIPTTGNIYPNIIKLCATAAVIPVSTAEVERVFSGVKRIVTDLRNRLKVETTNKLLHVHKNDKYLNFENAVKRWTKSKKRRILII